MLNTPIAPESKRARVSTIKGLLPKLEAVGVSLHYQWQLLCYALMFYTRLPVRLSGAYDPAMNDHASRYFTAVGWLVGALCALVFYLTEPYFGQSLAVLLSTAFGIWLTGAFHEDGLADTCDGMGGGWSREKILEIMKDSRIGTYGVVGLGLVLSIKVLALSTLPSTWVALALIIGHVFSRWCANLCMYVMDYVRLDELSKAKPVTKAFAKQDFLIASVIAGPALCLLPLSVWPALLGAAPLAAYLAYQLRKWLGGYTGDTLGAMQQLCELGVYLGLLVVLA